MNAFASDWNVPGSAIFTSIPSAWSNNWTISWSLTATASVRGVEPPESFTNQLQFKTKVNFKLPSVTRGVVGEKAIILIHDTKKIVVADN